MLNIPPVTKEQFYEFVLRPENRDRNFEYIAGEIVEVVSSGKSSRKGLTLVAEVQIYAKRHKLGRCTGADGGYVISGENYIPDGAFMSYARQPEPNDEAYNPLAPDLAIEMLSPGNSKDEITHKVGNYMAAGTVLWLGNPETKVIDVYIPGQPVKRLRVGEFLEGGDVLPGFRLINRVGQSYIPLSDRSNSYLKPTLLDVRHVDASSDHQNRAGQPMFTFYK